MAPLHISPIPAFADNYIWLITTPASTQAVVVDPGDAAPVLAVLEERGLSLAAVLITHHHRDHVGGVPRLRQCHPSAQVYAPLGESRLADVLPATEGLMIQIPGMDVQWQVMAVPGHTSDHVAYYGDQRLFCGDTLFTAGCGRVFSGSAAQLAASLRRLAALPADTLIYCAHEYTEDNLGFARWVEPDSGAVAERLALVERERAAGRATVPAPLALELATNPFLRTREPAVMAAASRYAAQALKDPTAVFTALREWKDREYD